MQESRLKIAIPLVCALLVTSIIPVVFAIEYLPGLTVGQWVKYKANLLSGNFTGLNPIPIDWMKMEVIAVSGKEITIRSSIRFLNGTVPTNSTSVYDVEYGLMNGTCSSFGPIMAANLKEGDEINLPRCGNPLKINKTETRTYLGFNRAVNILNMSMPFSFSMGNVTMEYKMGMTYIYDRTSGMMLEMVVENNMTKPTPTYMKVSIIVTDTNIFTTQTSTTTTTTATTQTTTTTSTPTSTTTTTQTTSSPTTTYTSTSTPTSTTTSITTTSSPTSTQQPSQGIPIEWIAVIVIIVLAVIVATLVIRRRK